MCWVVCGGFLSVFVFYTSLVESPTNFKQRYANYVHYTVQPQSYTTHSGGRELPLMRRRSHHLEISSATVSEEKRELKIK